MDQAIRRFEMLSPLHRRIELRKYSKHPRRLYKYRALRTNQEVDIQKRGRLRDVIVGNSLWLGRCEDFNDPFEGSVAYQVPTDEVEVRNALIRLAMRNGVSLRAARKLISPAVIHDKARILSIGDNAQKQLISNMGTCCFCATPRNPILWAHYADEHRGVCLQFDVAADVAALTSLEVKYDDAFPTASVFEDNNAAVLLPFLRKSTDWSYEREWRKFKPGGSGVPMPFRPQALAGVFFGCRCPESDREFVLELIEQRLKNGHPRPELFVVEKAYDRYRFIVRRFTNAP
jgi:hypothetical protein